MYSVYCTFIPALIYYLLISQLLWITSFLIDGICLLKNLFTIFQVLLILRKKDEIISNLQKEVEEVVHLKQTAENALSSSVPAPEDLIAKNNKLQELLDREIVEHLNTKLNLKDAEEKVDKLKNAKIESERISELDAESRLIQRRELSSQKEMIIDQAEQIQVNDMLHYL